MMDNYHYPDSKVMDISAVVDGVVHKCIGMHIPLVRNLKMIPKDARALSATVPKDVRRSLSISWHI